MDFCTILDANNENESTAPPTVETNAESTTEVVVENVAEPTVDESVENSAVTVPPPMVVSAPVPIPIENILIWPSMQDLNTRLRRVITSYQRNYKKEELKQQQKAKVNFSYHFLYININLHEYILYFFFLKHC